MWQYFTKSNTNRCVVWFTLFNIQYFARHSSSVLFTYLIILFTHPSIFLMPTRVQSLIRASKGGKCRDCRTKSCYSNWFHSLIHLFVDWIIDPFTRLFIQSFIQSFVQSLIHSSISMPIVAIFFTLGPHYDWWTTVVTVLFSSQFKLWKIRRHFRFSVWIFMIKILSIFVGAKKPIILTAHKKHTKNDGHYEVKDFCRNIWWQISRKHLSSQVSIPKMLIKHLCLVCVIIATFNLW